MNDFDKCMKVIRSCRTEEQLCVALRFFELYKNRELSHIGLDLLGVYVLPFSILMGKVNAALKEIENKQDYLRKKKMLKRSF